MHFGLKRIKKRQLKKFNSENYYLPNCRFKNAFRTGMFNFLSLGNMKIRGRTADEILRKAEENLSYCLKLLNMSKNQFMNEYKIYCVNKYTEGPTIEDAINALISEASYISDRYNKYRLLHFFRHIELCRYLIAKKTDFEINFISKEAIIDSFNSLMSHKTNNIETLKEFANYYNEMLSENTDPYWGDDILSPYESLDHLRRGVDRLSKEDNLNNIHLYQLFHSMRQYERVVKEAIFDSKGVIFN